MLKAINTMANLIRPAADRRPSRRTRSRSPPAATQQQHQQHQQPQQPQPPAAILTRRLSKTLPLPSDAPSAPAAAPTKLTPPGARKRSIVEVDTPEARPQSRAKQRRSYDDLSTWANLATKKLPHVDDVPSGASTPNNVDAAPDTPAAMADQKSLRSKNPKRKASELAEIFDDYDEIISKWEDGEAAESSTSAAGSDEITFVDEPLTAAQLAEFRESMKTAAATARADRPPPNPNHAYTARPPFDYSMYAKALPATADPLADSVYTKIHNKHEGAERKSRNRERDNLQYKMSKAPAVLEDLEGEDWHKVFFIDKAAREAWEPKRKYFIRELQTAIKKQDALRDIELEKKRREKEKRRREKESPDEDSDSDELTKPKRPPRRPRPSAHPSPHASPPHPRRPPRPHGFVLDCPPAPARPSAFKSFYPKGTRPACLSTSSSSSSKPNPPSTRPSSRHTRSADAPPFGVPLPSLLTRIEDAALVGMMREDDGFARRGEPTEDVLREDERGFQCFGLGGGFVTSGFLRENERKRRRRKRERESGGTTG